MNLDFLANIYQNVPTDWLIIGAFAIFAAFDVLRAGAKRVTTLALAIPLGVFLYATTSDAILISPILGQFDTPLNNAILTGIFIVLAYILIARIGLSWGGEAGQALQAALAGVSLTAILVTFWIATPALQTFWTFGDQIQLIFGEVYRFWWLIGAYAVLGFVRNSA